MVRVSLFVMAAALLAAPQRAASAKKDTLRTYSYAHYDGAAAYDEALAVACIEGIVNRDAPRLYVLSQRNEWAKYWYDKFSQKGWLAGRETVNLASFDDLVSWARPRIKGVVIWDVRVPATVNVATTLAGVENAVAADSAMAATLTQKYGLPVVKDLRGMFTGRETGSAKNDAYRWAIRELMDKGRCSTRRMCLFEDSYFTRGSGNVGYVVTRDLAVAQRCFVYDLSPWGDEQPKDDLGQKLGLDLETYHMLLASLHKQAADKHMTEVAGFFSFQKYSNVPGFPAKHEPVATEWENVYQISQYGCYQNTVADHCMNQSLHSQAPLPRLKQGRPKVKGKPERGKTYVCILMADYDSTTPLYEFMPNIWDNSYRGKMPLLWGINPNLTELYPDIVGHLYATRAPGDYFASDASAAGYFNPDVIKPEMLPLFTAHNKRFFKLCDMSIAPMVLDIALPTPAVKDAYRRFAPDGYATIIQDRYHDMKCLEVGEHLWKGMPVINLYNDAFTFNGYEAGAQIFSRVIKKSVGDEPGFYLFRIVWQNPETVYKAVEKLREMRPELDIEVLDGYAFFNYCKQSLEQSSSAVK